MRRDWSDVRVGRECLRCGLGAEPGVHLERAHLVPRANDVTIICDRCGGTGSVNSRALGASMPCPDCGGGGDIRYVDPRRIVTLCRHIVPVHGALVPGGCHPAFDAGRIDILDRLSLVQQSAVVEVLGIEGALARLAPSRRREAL